MKRVILFFTILISLSANAQNKPIVNLTWQQTYDFGYYDYTLQWDAPIMPHDELLGYHIYRDNELYQFQTEPYLTTLGINPNGDQNFMQFDSEGDGFAVHVTAVYGPNFVESPYFEIVAVQNNLLNLKEYQTENLKFYPNPTTGTIYFTSESIRMIKLYDLLGKKVLELQVFKELDLSHLEKGLYLMELISKDDIRVFQKVFIN